MLVKHADRILNVASQVLNRSGRPRMFKRVAEVRVEGLVALFGWGRRSAAFGVVVTVANWGTLRATWC